MTEIRNEQVNERCREIFTDCVNFYSHETFHYSNLTELMNPSTLFFSKNLSLLKNQAVPPSFLRLRGPPSRQKAISFDSDVKTLVSVLGGPHEKISPFINNFFVFRCVRASL